MEVSDTIQTEPKINPAVTVVIPTYNRAHFLKHTISSVLAQTFSDFELIIVDDGSTDNTADIVKQFSDPRIRFIPLGKNCGGNYARNQGIKSAHSELIAFLDSDDEWLPNKLELQINCLQNNNSHNANIIYCAYFQYYESTKRKIIITGSYEGNVFHHLLQGWCPALSTFIIRRSSLLEIGGFDENLPSFQDYDLFLRLAKNNSIFAVISEPLVTKIVHESQQVSRTWISKLKGFQMFRERWRADMINQLGFWGYRRWVANHLSFVKLSELQKSVENEDRLKAIQNLLAMSQFLPWSVKEMFKGFIFISFGNNVYASLSKFKNARSDINEAVN